VSGSLVGVTSRGGSAICGATNVVYTDVSAFSSWIRQTTENDQPTENDQTTENGTQTPDPGATEESRTPQAAPGAVEGLHVTGGDWPVLSAQGTALGVVRSGEVITVDCQTTGPVVTTEQLGTSRIWDHVPGRGFISDLAVAETPDDTRDPRLPACRV
jgi:secreted trypsin-like serine protease